MKRAFLAVLASWILATSSGCLHHNVAEPHTPHQPHCSGGNCDGLLGGLLDPQVRQAMHESHGWRHQDPRVGPQGPPTGTYAYPYYTLHGPRDFLVDNPPSLGN
jgi:hypothetical protein